MLPVSCVAVASWSTSCRLEAREFKDVGIHSHLKPGRESEYEYEHRIRISVSVSIRISISISVGAG